jgi:hypothetical protein
MLMGGFENMVDQGIHLGDLHPITHPDPNMDLRSLYQLRDIARIQQERTEGVPRSHQTRIAEEADEPLIEPEVARHWLTIQTHRAVEEADGSLKFREGTNPDHLGYAAMAIAMGNEAQFFTEAYCEATDNEEPIADFVLREYAQDMVKTFTRAQEAGSE